MIFFKTILIQLPCNPFKYNFVHMRQKKTFKVLSQEGLTIVLFLNKLIASCKEAVRFPFYFLLGGGVIFKLDSYFLFKLKGCFLYFTL
jgi:hypothetical protein